MSRAIKLGSADQSTVIRIVDSGDGTPETGVTSATSGLDLKYRREGGAAVSLTESDLAAADSAHSDGGLIHLGGGYYRVDLPDAACASGSTGVLVFGTVTGMVVIAAYHPLVAYDPQDTVRLGLTALPNAAADAAGGLPISDAGGLDLDNQLVTKINDILTDTGTTLQGELDGIQADTEDIQSRLPAALSNGNMKCDVLAVSEDATAADRLETMLDGTGGQTLSADITGNLSGSVGSVTGFTVDGSSLTAVPWNAAWDAEVQSECTDALNAYDPPTNAEMEARTLVAASYATAAAVSGVQTDVTTLLSRITATLFSGITSLAQWLGLLAGKQTGNSTARTELRATGAGSGTFDETTDSQEALRDRGDAAWVTATGFSTLDAAGVRTAVGLASANLDTQLSTIDTVVDAILADTGTDGVVLAAAGLQTDAVQEIRNAITGGAYALDTDSNGAIRLVDGTGSRELNTSGGFIAGIAGTLNTLDALDTAQDAEHDATQAAIAALNNLSAAQVNAQVLDVLAVDTFAMPGSSTPSATPTLKDVLLQWYQQGVLKTDQTTTALRIYNFAGDTVVQSRTASDSGGTTTLGKVTAA